MGYTWTLQQACIPEAIFGGVLSSTVAVAIKMTRRRLSFWLQERYCRALSAQATSTPTEDRARISKALALVVLMFHGSAYKLYFEFPMADLYSCTGDDQLGPSCYQMIIQAHSRPWYCHSDHLVAGWLQISRFHGVSLNLLGVGIITVGV